MPILKSTNGPKQVFRRPLHLVLLNGSIYCLGFSWQSVDKKFNQAALTKSARASNSDYWTFYLQQLGLGQSRVAKQFGQATSLAVKFRHDFTEKFYVKHALSKQHGRVEKNFNLHVTALIDMLAMLQFENLAGQTIYWLYAQKNGLFVPGYCDAVFRTQAECQQACLEVLELVEFRAKDLFSTAILQGSDFYAHVQAKTNQVDLNHESGLAYVGKVEQRINDGLQGSGNEVDKRIDDRLEGRGNVANKSIDDGLHGSGNVPKQSIDDGSDGSGNVPKQSINDGVLSRGNKPKQSIEDGVLGRDSVVENLDAAQLEEIISKQQVVWEWLSKGIQSSFWQRFSNLGAIYKVTDRSLPIYRLIKKIILFCVLCASLIVGCMFGLSYLHNFDLTTLTAKQRSELTKRKNYLLAHREQLFAQEWRYLQAVQQSFTIGKHALQTQVPLSYQGWQFDKATVHFQHQDKITTTTLEILFKHTKVASYLNLPKEVRLAKDAKAIILSLPLAEQRAIDQHVTMADLKTAQQIKLFFYEIAQSFKIKTSLNFKPQQTHKIKELGIFTCPWSCATFNIEAVRMSQINALAAFLSSIQGIGVDKITLHKSNYQIEGHVYCLAEEKGL